MNAKRLAWELKYKKAKADAHPLHQCPVCGRWAHKDQMSPHHPRGRRGENILDFFYVHEIPCHRWIHHNVGEATEKGWLKPNR